MLNIKETYNESDSAGYDQDFDNQPDSEAEQEYFPFDASGIP